MLKPQRSIQHTSALILLAIAGTASAQQALHEPPASDHQPDTHLRITETDGKPAALHAPQLKDLSDLCWLSGDRYLAVSDKAAIIVDLSIQLDPRGHLHTINLRNTHPILNHTAAPARLNDLESLTCFTPLPPEGGRLDSTTRTPAIYLAEEAGRIHRIADPDRAWAIDARPVFVWRPPLSPRLRGNRGIESMTIDHDFTLYTVNEDAATDDGPVATFTRGASVRLQAFRRRTPRLLGYRYLIDPINGDSPFTDKERAGLVELEALPDGRLLALERAAGATGLRIRLYAIDPQAAKPQSVVRKTRLWEKTFLQPNANFEGLTLGPELADGTHALILIADNGGIGDHLFYALKLHGLPEKPR